MRDPCYTSASTSSYDPYGAVASKTGTATSLFGFTGELTDPSTGLVYLRARDYDPKTGQFLTVDPVVAQTRQPYAYTGNRPLDRTDPTGLCPETPGSGNRPCTADDFMPGASLFISPDALQFGEILKTSSSGLFGVADTASFGLTRALRQANGVECSFTIDETQYAFGEAAGFAGSLFVGGGWIAKAGSKLLDLGPLLNGFRAASSPARFAVSSAGEATAFLRAGSASMEISEHAALRMTQRDVSVDAAEMTLARGPFSYFHNGAWKSGYYDPSSRIFLGSVGGRVTTVISNAKPGYIENLKAAVP